MEANTWPVVIAVVVAVGAYLGTWLKDRNNPSTQVVTSALATTEAMQHFIAPLTARIADNEKRLADLSLKVATLEGYVAVLQEQIRGLGAEPIPFSSHQTYRVPKSNEGNESS